MPPEFVDVDTRPPCSFLDSRMWTDPESRAEARAAADVCINECPVLFQCLVGARRRGEWGVWGGRLLAGGRCVENFTKTFWSADRHPRPLVFSTRPQRVGVPVSLGPTRLAHAETAPDFDFDYDTAALG